MFQGLRSLSRTTVFIYMDILTIITEEVQRLYEQQQQIFTIPDLAKALSVHGHDAQNQQILAKMLFDKYRSGGDQAVIDMYGKMSGVEIQALRNGRYMFANLSGGGEPMLQEILDNANHTPDEMPS